MSIKSDKWIRHMAKSAKMIEPFEPSQVRTGVSYGTSSYGYDFRVADEWKIPSKNASAAVLDPKNHDESFFDEIKADHVIIPPGSFVLGKTVEYFRIPRNVLTSCFGKSTYARCGVIINVTPFEPEWEGYATLSIINGGPAPVKIYANEGIAQLLFFESDEDCETSYADKKGKYQAQKKITTAKV